MAKNVYFSQGTRSEQLLYEDLIIESMKIYGQDVYYLPREMVTTDRLFREDVLSKFDENYLIEMYLQNYDGFQGDGTLLTKFGVRIAEEATFIVSKRRWEDLVQSRSNNLVSTERPNEGDAIYFPLTQQLFQIKFVENETPLRPLGDVPIYTLTCELMEYADERLETGVEEIDKIAAEQAYSIVHNWINGIKYINVTSGGSGYGGNTTVTLSAVTGAAAPTTIVPTITNGSVSAIVISNPGQGYTTTAPTVTITGTGTGAAAEAILPYGGTFKFGEDVHGTKFTADVISDGITSTYGVDNSFTIRKGGTGYTVAPTVKIGKPNAVQATATATLTSDVVTSVTVTNGGTCYTSAPTVTFSAPTSGTTATGTAVLTNGIVTSITITDGGTGYTEAPTVTIAEPPKAQASATTTIANGIVTGVSILVAGSGYSSAPRIIIAPSPSEPKGKVARYDVTNKELELIDIVGKFSDDDTLIGDESWAETVIDSFSSIEIENAVMAENKYFEDQGDNILDWTESNPFGEYGDQGVF
jgi:hypothetical protein